MPQYSKIVDAGLQAAILAQAAGAKIEINAFKIGSDYGFVPNVNETAVRGLVYTGVSGELTYLALTPNKVLYRVSLDPSKGDFQIGNIGLYLSDGTLFALTSLTGPTQKEKSNLPSVAGNYRHFDILLTFENLQSTLNFTVNEITSAQVPEVNTEGALPAPNAAPFTLYLVKQNSLYSNQPTFAYTNGVAWTYGLITANQFMLYKENPSSPIVPTINAGALNGVAIGHGAKIEGTGQRSTAIGIANVEGNENIVGNIGSNAVGYKTFGNYHVVFGYQNRGGTALGHEYNVVVGGATNLAEANYGFIGGGRQNHIENGADYAGIGGYRGRARMVGQQVHSVGRFAADGDAQASRLIVRTTTTNATPTELLLEGGGRLVLEDNETWGFSAEFVARCTTTQESGFWRVEGKIDRVSGAASVVIPIPTLDSRIAVDVDAWTIAVTADTANGSLKCTFTGEVGKTIRVVGIVQLRQIKV